MRAPTAAPEPLEEPPDPVARLAVQHDSQHVAEKEQAEDRQRAKGLAGYGRRTPSPARPGRQLAIGKDKQGDQIHAAGEDVQELVHGVDKRPHQFKRAVGLVVEDGRSTYHA